MTAREEVPLVRGAGAGGLKKRDGGETGMCEDRLV